jgi:hypothetical protein
VSRDDLARRYGYFLDHLDRTHMPLCSGEPAGQVTPDNVATYIAELRQRVSSVTLYGSVHKLRRVSELMSPGRDWAWLREIENDLDFLKVPGSKSQRLVSTSALVEAGLTLCQEAELVPPEPLYRSLRRESRAALRRARGVANRRLLDRAVLARDGLIIALLALCPIRLRNFAALKLGTSFQKIGSTW